MASLPLCKTCGLKPVWVDHTGMHPYCGKTCAQQAEDDLTSSTTYRYIVQPNPTRSTVCKICRRKPVFVENGRERDYCSKTCAQIWQGTDRPTPRHRKQSQASRGTLCEVCRKRPVFVENGREHAHCSKTCAQKALDDMLDPVPRKRTQLLSGPSRVDDAASPWSVHMLADSILSFTRPLSERKPDETSLRELPLTNNTARKIAANFVHAWKSNISDASVKKVYEIIPTHNAQEAFTKYKTSSAIDVAEVGTYYGSQCVCSLGTGEVALCTIQSCGICMAVRSSFRELACGDTYDTGRYGLGLYSYCNPAKADRFVTSCTTSPFRVIIESHTLISSRQPRGVATSLIDDDQRVFVSHAEAILPKFIICYKVKV